MVSSSSIPIPSPRFGGPRFGSSATPQSPMRKIGRRTACQYNRHIRGQIPVPLSSPLPKAGHGRAAELRRRRLVQATGRCPDLDTVRPRVPGRLQLRRRLHLVARHRPRPRRSYTRPQTPCLFYTTAAGAELYSLAAGKSFRLPELPAPPIADRYIWGSSHGWLATADKRSELHIFNPATGEQLALPPVATIEQVNPVLDDAGELSRYDVSFYDATVPRKETQPPQPYGVGELREVLYLKVILSGDPSRGGDCTAMLIHNPRRQLSFARVGDDDERWHWVTTSPRYSEYSDCIYHDGAFYAMNRQGGIHRYTIAGTFASCEVIFKDTLPYDAFNVYIARASSGDVLQIWRYTDIKEEEPKEMHTDGFEIYKLDLEKQCGMELHTLGDDALLIGHSYTCCLSTKDYPKLLPDHVYFTDDSEYWLMERKNIRRDVGVYNFEDESFHDLVTPQLWLNWPNPIWITPSFTKINY